MPTSLSYYYRPYGPFPNGRNRLQLTKPSSDKPAQGGVPQAARSMTEVLQSSWVSPALDGSLKMFLSRAITRKITVPMLFRAHFVDRSRMLP